MNWRPLISPLVLTASLLLTSIATWTVVVSTNDRDEVRFTNAVQGARNRIETRLETYIALLRGGAGLFAASDLPVTYEDFREYTNRLNVQARYPGIQGFGFTQRIQPAQHDSLIAAMRTQGFPDFKLTPEGLEGERHAILYLEPQDERNEVAIGYDMYSEPIRREAMDRAWRTGEAAVSGKVTLVQEIAGREQAGFLIYVPVYEAGTRLESEARRLATLRGFVYAPFRADDLLEGMFDAAERPRVAFQIYDGPEPRPDQLLHDSAISGIAPSSRASFHRTVPITIAGRTWTIAFTETDLFASRWEDSLAFFVAGIGLLVSALLYLLSRAQVRAETSLRASEGRLRAVLESLPVGVLVADTSGEITFTNAAARRLWGGEPDGVPSAASPRTADDPRFASRNWGVGRALRGESTRSELVEIETRDGMRRTVLNAAFPLRDPEGHVTMAIVALVDITEQKQAEEAMREREREFSTLANAIPQLAWMADATGDAFWFNERWYDYTGLTLEASKGRGWQSMTDPAHLERVTERFRAHIDSGESWEDLFPLRSQRGDYRWFLTLASPVRDQHGRVFRWVGTHTDVTEQIKAQQAEARAIREFAAREAAEAREEQLRLQALELERSNRELQDFAYVASHDLQEPLRKILAFADLLQREYSPQFDEQGAFYLERTQSAARRMSSLIKDLLAFSRVTTRGRAFEAIDLNEVVSDVLSDLSIRLSETEGRVEVGELPTIEADVVQMRQLFQNLIGNALKFHRPGVPPLVHVYAEDCLSVEDPEPRPGQLCRVEVSDNGIGFDEKYLDRIFTPFQRLHPQSEYEGTGIGLAICRRIVERHGGILTARSEFGEGSTFVVTLPVKKVVQGDAA